MPKSRTLPPVYFLGALVLAVALHYAVPLAQVVPRPWHLVGVLLIAIGLVFIVVPARTFKARDTAIKPSDVSSVLVQDGFFSISRNPMYLGMVLRARRRDAPAERHGVCGTRPARRHTADTFHTT